MSSIPLSDNKLSKKYGHSFMVSGTKFVVDLKYVPIKRVGTGAYGVVCAAKDTNTNKKIAIKKVSRAFADLIDAKRIVREIRLLRHFKHRNIISIVDLINPISPEEFNDIYIIFDFMETDLHKIIYSKNSITPEHQQYFLFQLLCGLKYIHSSNVIHRDLKPSNLLLNGNCDLKICDFGLSRGISHCDNYDYELTEYVVTRWYRAPEIMCANQEYDEKIDVWSVGCILAELIQRKPLFPGEDYINQLNLIFKLIGTPTEEDMRWITNPKAADYIRSLPKREPIPFEQYFGHLPTATDQAIDLLKKMLVFNPHKRISVAQSIQHEFLKALRPLLATYDSKCEKEFDFDFELYADTEPGIKALLLEEISFYRPDLHEQYEKIYSAFYAKKKIEIDKNANNRKINAEKRKKEREDAHEAARVRSEQLIEAREKEKANNPK